MVRFIINKINAITIDGDGLKHIQKLNNYLVLG